MLFKVFIALLIFNITLHAKPFTIAAAANTSYVMQALIDAYKVNHPDLKITLTIASSGKLTSQIAHGAPYDLFFSADMHYPNYLASHGHTLTEPKIYAKGALALYTAKHHDLSQGLALLNAQNIRTIALANPKLAPYGKAAYEALTNAKLLPSLLTKIIYAESIAGTLQYTLLHADIGLIATSALFAPELRHKSQQNTHWIPVPTSLYTPINQGVVLLKHAKNHQEAEAFYHFIFSPQAQRIFKAYGYTL